MFLPVFCRTLRAESTFGRSFVCIAPLVTSMDAEHIGAGL